MFGAGHWLLQLHRTTLQNLLDQIDRRDGSRKAHSDAKATMTVIAVSMNSDPDSERLGSSVSPPCIE